MIVIINNLGKKCYPWEVSSTLQFLPTPSSTQHPWLVIFKCWNEGTTKITMIKKLNLWVCCSLKFSLDAKQSIQYLIQIWTRKNFLNLLFLIVMNFKKSKILKHHKMIIRLQLNFPKDINLETFWEVLNELWRYSPLFKTLSLCFSDGRRKRIIRFKALFIYSNAE